MIYKLFNIYLNETGRSNPEKVKNRLYELLGEDKFTTSSFKRKSIMQEDYVEQRIVLQVGIELTPMSHTVTVGNSTFSEFVTQMEGVASVESFSGA